MEIWKDIPGYEKYQASNIGNIRSYWGKGNSVRILRFVQRKRGYRLVGFSTPNGKGMAYVHRLVALAFIPNPDNKVQVNHKDGDASNNRVENLEWATPSENMQHSYDTGLHNPVRGEKNPIAKLSEPQVLEIRRRAASGESVSRIKKDYDVGHHAIYCIVTNRAWKHLNAA